MALRPASFPCKIQLCTVSWCILLWGTTVHCPSALGAIALHTSQNTGFCSLKMLEEQGEGVLWKGSISTLFLSTLSFLPVTSFCHLTAAPALQANVL